MCLLAVTYCVPAKCTVTNGSRNKTLESHRGSRSLCSQPAGCHSEYTKFETDDDA